MSHCQLFTDGGTRGGNPGYSASGFVIMDVEGETLLEWAQMLEGKCSNNVAEYCGLIAGLSHCAALGFKSVDVFTDSKIMAEQMSGVFAVRTPALKECFDEATMESEAFDHISYNWVSRKFNQRADYIVRQILDAFMDERAKKAGAK